MPNILPNTQAPALSVPLVGGETFDIASQSPENFTLLLFYRGLHCPICKGQLRDLQNNLDELDKRGIEAVAISMDSEERASKSKEDWGLDKIDLAYGLSEEQARSYGLYLSHGINEKEPALFSEPGLFLVRTDGTIYFASIQSMPFTRPALKELLMGVDYALQNNYPARGEVA